MALTKMHKAIPFFCAPGNHNDFSDTLKATYNSTTTPQPWPWGRILRVKILPNEKVFEVVRDIVKATSLDWVNGLGDGLSLQWVGRDETADIRISFRPDAPSWSAWGTRALQYDQGRATMNFSFGGWQDKKAVYSHAQIARVAAHLFGHALGLPHALLQWPSGWNKQELVNNHGSFFAGLIESDAGSASLQASNSIMRFDRPAGYGAGSSSDEKRGGSQIDDEARNALKKLYLEPPAVYLDTFFGTGMNNWRAGVGEMTAEKWIATSRTANAVSNLFHVDLGLTGNFRLRTWLSEHQRGTGYRLKAGTWADSQIHQLGTQVLSFDETDQRVQTGSESLNGMRGVTTHPAGVVASKRINFPRPFRTTARVVAWITMFDTLREKQIRVSCMASSPDQTGFTLEIKSWGDSIVYEIKIQWLAHESDDPSIRSGLFESPWRGQWIKEDRVWATFSSPLLRSPRTVFRGMSHIDTHCTNNIRVAMECPQWNEKAIEARFYTWVDESKFDCVKGVYVAFL